MRIIHNIILAILSWRVGHQRGSFLLRQWLDMETKKEQIIKSVGDTDLPFPQYLLEYLEIAFRVPKRRFERADWIRIVSAFYSCISASPKVQLPITTPTDEVHKEDDWSYPQRTWNLYSHMLCKTYGWDLEYVAQLDVFDALAHIQEIITDDQLEKEFYYGLSENAYSYDPRTKKSKFIPLPRPHWMRKKARPIQKFIIPASMIPSGVINMDALPDEYLPKAINHN